MILDILTVLFFVLGFVLVLWMIGERRRDVLHGPYVTKEVAEPGWRALSRRFLFKRRADARGIAGNDQAERRQPEMRIRRGGLACRSNSLIPPNRSLFPERFSLLICVGNFLKSN